MAGRPLPYAALLVVSADLQRYPYPDMLILAHSPGWPDMYGLASGNYAGQRLTTAMESSCAGQLPAATWESWRPVWERVVAQRGGPALRVDVLTAKQTRACFWLQVSQHRHLEGDAHDCIDAWTLLAEPTTDQWRATLMALVEGLESPTLGEAYPEIRGKVLRGEP